MVKKAAKEATPESPIATRYGTGFRNPTSPDAIDSVFRCAEIRAVNSTVEVGEGDEPGSRYFVGYVPSSGLLDAGSLVMHDATGLTVQLGFKDNPNAFGEFDMSLQGGGPLVDLQDTAGTDVGINDLGQRFWEHAGLPRDPGGELDVLLTVVGGAGVADTKIHCALKYYRQG
jgi:hypothetical protein